VLPLSLGGNARQQPSRYPNLALGVLVPMATLTAHGLDVACVHSIARLASDCGVANGGYCNRLQPFFLFDGGFRPDPKKSGLI